MKCDLSCELRNNRRVAMGLYVTIYLQTELRNKFYSKHPVAIRNKRNLNIGHFVFLGLRKQIHT